MVGRTSEYVGKKIEKKEVKMAIVAVLATREEIGQLLYYIGVPRL
jgi:K+-transporting ATPase A subunit